MTPRFPAVVDIENSSKLRNISLKVSYSVFVDFEFPNPYFPPTTVETAVSFYRGSTTVVSLPRRAGRVLNLPAELMEGVGAGSPAISLRNQVRRWYLRAILGCFFATEMSSSVSSLCQRNSWNLVTEKWFVASMDSMISFIDLCLCCSFRYSETLLAFSKTSHPFIFSMPGKQCLKHILRVAVDWGKA